MGIVWSTEGLIEQKGRGGVNSLILLERRHSSSPFLVHWWSWFFLKIIYLLAAPCNMWDLSFLTRDRSCAPGIGSTVLITGLPGKSCGSWTFRLRPKLTPLAPPKFSGLWYQTDWCHQLSWFSSLQIASWSWDFSASITCEPIPVRNPPHIYGVSVNPLGALSLEKPWLTHCHFPHEVPRPTGTSSFSSKAGICASQQLSFPGSDYGCLCCLEIPFGVFVLISPSSETVTRTLRKGPDGLGKWEFQFDN